MEESELFVVPGERQVERLAREGKRAETRTSLRSRLVAALLPDTVFVQPRECRLILAMALADPDAGSPAAQLDLFGDGRVDGFGALSTRGGPPAGGDALLAAARARGGASWGRLVAALDDAITLLRTRGATVDHLDRVARERGFLGVRARTLSIAMRALDARLARAGARDGRLTGALLANAVASIPAEQLSMMLGARSLRARWLLTWEPADMAWWRALDDKLAPRGGGARVALPSFDRPLSGSRERDPLDALAEEVTRGLDSPIEIEPIAPVLGDLTGVMPESGAEPVSPDRVRVYQASDVVAQARAVAQVVSEALEAGAAVERITIALPLLDERTLAPLRRALIDAGVVCHEARGAAPSNTPVVTAAFLALDAAASFDRHVVARLLRSGWIDASRLSVPEEDRRDAEHCLRRLARALETSATAAGGDVVERLVRTATTSVGGARQATSGGAPDADADRERNKEQQRTRDISVIERLAGALARSRGATTRIEHVQAARALWAELGIAARAGRGGLASFTSDGVPTGVPRAERLAIARDARAWDALVGALDLYEQTVNRVGAGAQALDAGVFRLELIEFLDATTSQPGGARAAAVRIARLAEVAGDALDLLVVVDANEGILPRDGGTDPLVSDALADAIARSSRAVFVAPVAGAQRARELSALALAAAEARAVVLVFAREDASGAPLAPSLVVDAMERAGIALLEPQAAVTRASGFEDVPLRVAREREREGFFLDPSRPRSDVVGDLAPGPAAAELLVVETGGAGRALAVTGLERLARCAFMGFAHVVLAAREAELKEELPDAREEGTLVHEALAAAFRATRDLWPKRPRPSESILAAGQLAADDILDRWQGHAPLRAVVRLRVADAVRAVLEVAIADSVWDFTLAEQTFGARGGESWTPLILGDQEVRLSLRGSIDRVDRAHDGRALRVIDYKRSKSTVSDAARSLGDTALQVPLYACVASRELGLPSEGIYMATQARDVAVDAKPNVRADQRMAELLARTPDAALTAIERRALDLVTTIRSGALAPVPAHESECRYCAVSGGCRKPRFAMAPREDADDEGDAVRPARDTH